VIHSTELDDPADDEPPATALAPGGAESEDESACPLDSDSRRPEIEAEFELWSSQTAADRRTGLRQVIRGGRAATAETLVRLCCLAHEQGDRQTLNLAFEALSKVVTPLLLSQAWGMSADERREQVQEILLETFAAIQSGKADFAANRFAAFAKRRSISLYRVRCARFEGVNERKEPTDEDDPLDKVPARIPGAEGRALLTHALGKLPLKHRAAVIQYHLFEMTQEEIATHHGVSVRTVYSWLKKAEAAVGFTGDEDDC